jgi:hypothetical protein
MSTKHQTIQVYGTVIYCDECGKRGPQEVGEDTEELVALAKEVGWTVDDQDRDLCPDCSRAERR